ncbi:MAG: DNA-binding response regulator [Dehalococcoidia bacterium]|nr:DNA-binding response regulator [Dehalococcoidia bacterium]
MQSSQAPVPETSPAPESAGRPIRLMLVDDHPLVLEGLRSMLSTDPEIEIVAEATGGRDAIAQAQAVRPALILMDIRMTDLDGIAATRTIKASLPQTAVVMLTMYENPDYLFEAVRAGASGYVLKDVRREPLLEAIRTVADGGSLLNQEVVSQFMRRLAAESSRRDRRGGGPADQLTPREIDVLRLIARGYTNKEIANDLSVTVATVKTHVEHIMQKLQVSDRTQAAVQAVTLGVVS